MKTAGLACILAMTALTACNNDEVDGISVPNNQLQLKFGVNNPTSRAIFTESTLPNAKPVGVKLDDGDETAYDKYINITFTGSTDDKGVQVWTPSEAVVLGPTKATLYAYYPWTSGVSIDAIPVDMTAEDQTDWLYATPVENVNEDNASHAVTMNHALANINLTINRGSYVGDGNISSITVQSDAFATKGTFNAAQPVPAFTSFADTEGQPLTRTITATLGSTTDIMVVPTATEDNIDFIINVDGVNYTAQAKPVQLVNGNSYLYTLTLNSTFLGVSEFSVTPWGTQQKDDDLQLDKYYPHESKVYAVRAGDEALVELNDIDTQKEEYIAVALHVVGKNFDQKFWIEKTEDYHATENSFPMDKSGILRYNWFHYLLPFPDGNYYYWNINESSKVSSDYTTWEKNKSIGQFNGKELTEDIKNITDDPLNVGSILNTFNTGQYGNNQGYDDWFLPSDGQMGLIWLNILEINQILTVIGAEPLDFNWESQNVGPGSGGEYWTSNINVFSFDSGNFSEYNETAGNFTNYARAIRFIRDIVAEEKAESPTTPTINSAGKPNGVYVVTAAGELVDKTTVAADAIGVALITDNQRIMIPKTDATNDGSNYQLYWGKNLRGKSVATENDFNGKASTAAIIAAYTTYGVEMDEKDMCKVLKSFNDGTNTQSNEGYDDWYVPALKQLVEIISQQTDINAALTSIDGITFQEGQYWTSTERSETTGWNRYFNGDDFDTDNEFYKDAAWFNVRFVRNID